LSSSLNSGFKTIELFPNLDRLNMKRYSPTSKTQAGLTLIEIMIALTISLVLLAGVVQIFISAKQSYNIQQALSRVQENARMVNDTMLRDISSAGYMGCLGTPEEVINTLSDKSSSYDYASSIEGTDGGAGNPDSITVRHVSEASAIPVMLPMTSQSAPLQLTDNRFGFKQWDVVTVSDCSHVAIFMITNVPATSGTVEIQHAAGMTAPDDGSTQNAGQSNTTDDLQHIFGSPEASNSKIYSVGTTSYEIKASTNNPKKKSLFITPGGEIEGIEDMQIQYGIGNSPASAGTPVIAEQYLDANDPGIDWKNVVAVRITFVANSVDLPVKLGEGDGLLHKTFTTTIRLRNKAPA